MVVSFGLTAAPNRFSSPGEEEEEELFPMKVMNMVRSAPPVGPVKTLMAVALREELAVRTEPVAKQEQVEMPWVMQEAEPAGCPRASAPIPA